MIEWINFYEQLVWDALWSKDALKMWDTRGEEKNDLDHSSVFSRWVSVVEFHDRALCMGKVFGQELSVVEGNY